MLLVLLEIVAKCMLRPHHIIYIHLLAISFQKQELVNGLDGHETVA